MYCYQPNEIPERYSLVHCLETNTGPTAAQTQLPTVAIQISKYAVEKKEWPSLAAFCYSVFPLWFVGDDKQTLDNPLLRLCHVNRASMKIAMETRRGRGNVILTSRTTKFNFHCQNPYAAFQYASHIGYLDGLADTDVLVLYAGAPKIDGGFFWHPNEDGTVSVQCWDKTKDYGIIVRFPD